MLNRKFNFLLIAVAKHLATLILGVIILVGCFQAAAWANPTAPSPGIQAALTLNPLIAAASSRFAAQTESAAAVEGREPIISESRLNEMREQRRKQQSQASAAAAAAAAAENDKSDDSVGEVIKDRLNLDEITQENEIFEGK